MAHDPAARHHINNPGMQIRSPFHLHHTGPTLPRRPTPRNLLRRPHRPHLVPRHLRPAQPAARRQPAHRRRARPGRIPARDDAARPPALGLGLRLQCGFSVPGHRVQRPLRPAVGTGQPEHHQAVQRAPPGRRVCGAQRHRSGQLGSSCWRRGRRAGMNCISGALAMAFGYTGSFCKNIGWQ
jgi:hypothetical protein